MSSTSTEDGAPGKRRLQSPEEGAGPASWVVKRQRSGALVPGSNELQRSERQTQAASPAPSGGGSAGTGASPKPRRSQTSARPFTCQVEDCTRDVCELSTYHFRYRICNVHIRLPAFMRQGKLQRFCQQCGRCHELSEFEGNQRSCRAQLDRHNARRRQAKKNAQAAKSGAAGHSVATSAASQPLSGAHQGASTSREAPRAYSADLEHYQRNRAIRPVGKLGQAMPAAEAAALLAAAANGQPRFALGGATSAFGQYNEASAAGASQHSGSRFPNLAQVPARQPALFKRGPQRPESEESMSQQPQISSSSSDGAGQTAEASAALQSLYNFARSSQQDGASSRAPGMTTYRRPERDEGAKPSPATDEQGKDRKTTLSPREKEQAAAVAAELSARTPDEGVAKIAPLAHAEGKEEGSSPAADSAVHPKLRQKTNGSSRAAAISTWQQHSDNSSSAPLAGLPALASAAAAAQDELEGAENEKEQAEPPPVTEEIDAKRVGSNTQSDPIEPQPTPFEAFTQAPLSTEKPELAPPKARMQAPEVFPSTESSAMGFSQLSASRPPSDVRTASTRTGGTGSMASRSMSDSLAIGRSMDSAAPTEGSVARSLAERNAQLLGFLQKNHLLETSQAMAAMPAVGSATLSAALGQRAASTQSSMDVMTAENIAAALPELSQPLHEPAGRGASPLAPPVSSVPSGKPPAFPQGQRPGRLASVTEEEEPVANEDAVRHWLQYGRPPGTKGVTEPQEPPAMASQIATPQAERAAEKGLPERPQERKTLGGALPEGLRTALGLSAGQPVGQLQSAMEKGQLETGLPTATAATVAVATATVPTVLPGISAASAKMDAMLGSRAQLSKPQQLESTAAIQQPLSAPAARPAVQPGMEPARSNPPLSAFGSVPAEAPGAGLFRAAQMPMLPAANPMALHLYQTLMAASLMGAGGQHHLQEGAQLHAMPQAMNSAINPNTLLGPMLAPDGGQAAMAHLLAMRSEVMALHLSVKLFHCTPQELPEDAQEQLTAWLRQAPACTELYVRSGCVHLTVTAYVDEATAVEADKGGVLAAVKSLVQQPSDIWRKGSMLVSFMDDTVMVCDGAPERICALTGLCAGAPRAEPMVTMPRQLIALEVQKLPGATEPCTVLCRSRGSYWAIQAEALDSGSSSSSILYGVRLPEDMPPGMAYLEVEQGPFVSGSTPVLVMPPQRFMAAAEVQQLMRGTPIAATGLFLGGLSPAVAWQLVMGAFNQLGLSLKHSFDMPASKSVMAAPEGTPSALLAPPQALQPLAVAGMHANLLQLGLFWSMPNLAYMFMGGLQMQQLPEKQQQSQGVQQPFSFPQINMRAAGGNGWGLKPFQSPCQPRAPSPSPLALLAAAAQLTGCSA